MSPEPLPTTLDVRKAAARGSVVSGAVELAKLLRLREALASGEGIITARCAFGRDEESRALVTVTVSAELTVACQRCLQPMPLAIESENTLAIVGSDEMAKQLPASLDPWVVAEEQGDLWDLVEDELILEIPVVAYCDTDACKQLLDAYRQPPETPETDGDNPFKVLEQLKPGATQQEN
ncbi:MAG: YceD family protein [Halieaceae bacterium]|nr:YceD family protein [Halieaceae bacterium]